MKTQSLILYTLISVLLAIEIAAQSDSTPLQARISRYATQLLDSLPQQRLQAHDSLKNSLYQLLQQPKSWYHSLSQWQTLSVQYPPDSSFRFISWQVETAQRQFRHGGIIQHKQKPEKPILLHDRPPEALFSEYTSTDAQDWFGGICYALQDFKTENGQTAWLAFFYNSYSPYIARKWVDVIYFDENNQVHFGLPVFAKPDEFGGYDYLSRILMEYFSHAATRFRYDTQLNIIIKDHIIPYGALPDRSGPAPVPDGSYEGFRYKNGRWWYEEKIFHHVLEDGEAPRPQPILDQRKKRGIFGEKQ